jgi:diguanylate cyclase (GGDEF)-like protein
VDLNPAAQRIVGPASAIVGRQVEDLLGAAVPGSDEPVLSRRELVLQRDGRDLHYELLLSYLDDGRSGHAGDLLVLRDITERKQAQRDLEHIAHHDALTGLPNRLLFADRMEQALVRARRNGAQLAVLFLDIDQFKVINDGLGHDFGDRVLVHVAHRLGRALRAGDTLARLGGDEFSVILPEIAKPENGAIVAAKLLREVAEPLEIDDETLHITASIGIAVFPQDGRDQRELLSRADGAMYVAKGKAPGRFEFSSPEIQARADDRQRLENQLRQALRRGELFLEYQPVVDLASGATYGFEALARWDHPELGVLPPDRFMDWAEEIRLVTGIDHWVLGEACRQAASWQTADRLISVSVNLSPLTLDDAELPGALAATLDRSGLEPRCLCVELEERKLVDDGGSAAERLGIFKAMGLSVALDDFGVGHTSLSQIGRLPLDTLKIDRSFVRSLGGDGDETPIVAAMVEAAHIMGLDVVAEGVERADQLAVLRDLGCDKGQGFLFAPPLSPGRATALVADRSHVWPTGTDA